MERMKLTKCDPVKQARKTEFLSLEQRSEPAHRKELNRRKQRSTPTRAASSTAYQIIKEYNEMSTNELTSKVRELKELKAMAEEIAAEISTIEDAIKAEMTARETDEMMIDVYKIRWTKVKSNRFDSTAFRKAMPELAEKFTKTTETRRFSIA